MKWDAVERELLVVGTQLASLGRSFVALSAELHKERQFGSLSITEESVSGETNKKKAGGAPPLPF